MTDNDPVGFNAQRVRSWMRHLATDRQLFTRLASDVAPTMFVPMLVGDPKCGHWLSCVLYFETDELVIFDSAPNFKSGGNEEVKAAADAVILKPANYNQIVKQLQHLWLCRWLWQHRSDETLCLQKIVADWKAAQASKQPLFKYVLDYKKSKPVVPRQQDGWCCGYLMLL